MRIPGVSWLAKPFAYLAAEWGRMAPRERKLVAGLGTLVLLFATFVGVYLVVDTLGQLAEETEDMREALAAMAKHGDAYRDAKSRASAQEVRIGQEPPQLAADLEAASKEAGAQIAEQTERPSAPAGKHHLEHSVDVRLRQVDLQSLAKFLRRLETGPRLLLVNRLSLRRRFSEQDKLDVEMTLVAWERVKDQKKKPGDKDKGAAGSPGAGAAGSAEKEAL
jgi:type II secretory pathway component PulM